MSHVARPSHSVGRVWGHAVLKVVQVPLEIWCNTYLSRVQWVDLCGVCKTGLTQS